MIEKKKVILWFSLLFLTFFICAVILEVGTRIFLSQHQQKTLQIPPYQSIDPYKENPFVAHYLPYLYFFIPNSHYQQVRSSYKNSYKINALGFRGHDIPEKNNNIKRLLVIGDSIVEGHAIPFPQGLVAQLDKRLRPYGWEAVGVGMHGASPIYYATNLPRYLSLQPDAVLLFIHENDLYEDRVREKTYQQLPVLEDHSFLLAQKNKGIWEQSSFLKLVHNLWISLGESAIKNLVIKNLQQDWHTKEQHKLDKLSPFLVENQTFPLQWQMSTQYLQWIKQRLSNENIPLFMTSLCTLTLSPGLDKVFQQHCQNLQQHTQQWADQEKLVNFSLQNMMQEAFSQYSTDQILIPDDRHPTALIHNKIAEELFLKINSSDVLNLMK